MVALADFLNKTGFKVYVISYKGTLFSYYGYDELVKEIDISYIENNMKPVKPDNKNANIKDILNFRLKKLIKDLTNFFIIPDQTARMTNTYFKHASALIKKECIENVIISSPPHSMQKIGIKLKVKYKNRINLVVDYRDSWNNSTIFSQKNPIRKFLAKEIEKKVLKSADKFTYVSPPILSKIITAYGINISDKSTLIMNGYNSDANAVKPKTSQRSSKNKKITIGHFGAVTDNPKAFRSVHKLFRILSENKNIGNKLEFYFFGTNKFKLSDEELPDCVHTVMSLPHNKAIEKMHDMDYLLLIHSDKSNSDEVITGKLFDYISVKKPIICLSPEDMEAKRMIEKNNIGFWINYDNSADMINKFVKIEKNDYRNSYDSMDVEKYDRNSQNKRFLNLLK